MPTAARILSFINTSRPSGANEVLTQGAFGTFTSATTQRTFGSQDSGSTRNVYCDGSSTTEATNNIHDMQSIYEPVVAGTLDQGLIDPNMMVDDTGGQQCSPRTADCDKETPFIVDC